MLTTEAVQLLQRRAQLYLEAVKRGQPGEAGKQMRALRRLTLALSSSFAQSVSDSDTGTAGATGLTKRGLATTLRAAELPPEATGEGDDQIVINGIYDLARLRETLIWLPDQVVKL